MAAAIIAGFDRVVSPRVVRLIEDDDGGFAVEAAGKTGERSGAHRIHRRSACPRPISRRCFRGSRVEIVLQPKRFLFRPLELPARAADFLDGIVRAQIDRLTPWSASEAVFGCSAPVASGTESITTVIAATTRKVAMTYVQAVSGFHPAAIAVCTDVAERNAGRVKVFEQKARGHLDAARLSRALLVALGVAAAVALLSVTVAAYVADNLGAQESELARQISARRAAIRAGSDGGDRSPIAVLERRKYETPASVIVLDALSQVLPDHTYVTELHLAGNKLQIVRHHPRRAVADPADRAIPAFHPRHLLCADDALALRSRRALPYRGADRTEEHGEPMSSPASNAITRALTHSPLIAVVLYLAVTGGLLATAGFAIADIFDHQRALAQTSDLLDQLQGRKPRGGAAASLAAEHPGTPFLEGPTVTVAGATLLQRVAAAVGNVGGTIQSSQVDVLGTQAKDGFVGLVVSCEMEQPSAAEAALRSRGRHAVPVRRSARRAGAADDGHE